MINERHRSGSARVPKKKWKQYSPELTARVNGVLGEMSNRMKMHAGKPAQRSNSSILGWIEVSHVSGPIVQRNIARLSGTAGTISSSVALSSGQCNSVGILGLRRERCSLARGFCYTRHDFTAIGGWVHHINANFQMAEDFEPMIGQDLPAIRTQRHTCASSIADRATLTSEWIRRNFLISNKR